MFSDVEEAESEDNDSDDGSFVEELKGSDEDRARSVPLPDKKSSARFTWTSAKYLALANLGVVVMRSNVSTQLGLYGVFGVTVFAFTLQLPALPVRVFNVVSFTCSVRAPLLQL